MARSQTTWKAYPLKTSELMIGNWTQIWNIQKEEGAKINCLLSCMREKSPHIGWASNGEVIEVHHTGRGCIARVKSMRQVIRALEKRGILIDDLHLTIDFRFRVKD